MNFNFRKILVSMFTLGAVVGLGMMTTNAFFNDTETSTGNLLQAGALDLKIDNTCYYNGQACTNGFWGGQPNAEVNPTNTCTCTWGLKDLGEGDTFFNLTDLKPGDYEEDTISVHVDNPSWLCADITVTAHEDFTCTEPEQAAVGGENGACVAPNGAGDLAQELNFVFWSDDGDNVFEASEADNILTEGPADAVLGNVRWALADSTTIGGPIPATTTTYIGKYFCFGDLVKTPLADGEGNPVDRQGSGFTCDGSAVDNKSQTDRLTGDVVFYAEQARHNDAFRCDQPVTPVAPTGV